MKSAIVTRVTPREKRHTIMRNLEGVIKGLGDLWEMFAEGKLSDDMRKVHDCEAFRDVH
jgi:hypothetical protein